MGGEEGDVRAANAVRSNGRATHAMHGVHARRVGDAAVPAMRYAERDGSLWREASGPLVPVPAALKLGEDVMNRARRSLCNMHTCKLSQSVCTLPLQLSLARRWRPGSTRRIRRAWGWVQGARVRQGMDCHGSLCNSLCTVHVRMMGLHVHTLSLWGVPGRRRRRAWCGT